MYNHDWKLCRDISEPESSFLAGKKFAHRQCDWRSVDFG